MQNETNRWNIFFGKDEIFVKLFYRPKLSQFPHFLS